MTTMSKPVAEVDGRDVVQVCMTGTLFHQIVDYLHSRDLTIAPFAKAEDDIDTYMVGISQRLWDSVR